MKTILLFTVLFNASFSLADVYHCKENKVDFYAVGVPSMLKIHGESSELSGDITEAKGTYSGEFIIPMNSFTSKMKLRDSHLKDKVFEVEKFPQAKLSFKGVALKEATSVPFTGTLKFHGVEKAVKGDVTITIADKKIKYTTHCELLLTDFGIAPPEFAGMKINNEVKVEVTGSSL